MIYPPAAADELRNRIFFEFSKAGASPAPIDILRHCEPFAVAFFDTQAEYALALDQPEEEYRRWLEKLVELVPRHIFSAPAGPWHRAIQYSMVALADYGGKRNLTDADFDQYLRIDAPQLLFRMALLDRAWYWESRCLKSNRPTLLAVPADRQPAAQEEPAASGNDLAERRARVRAYQRAWLEHKGRKPNYHDIATQANSAWNTRDPIQKWLRGEDRPGWDFFISEELLRLPQK